MNRLSRFLIPSLLALTLLWVYASTLAPGLTWAHDGADGGDLITAAVTGGVPHPTGYPLFLLLAGFFQRLPIGPLAFRTNLFSAVAMTGAALVVFYLVRNFFSSSSEFMKNIAGLSAAFAFAFAPLVWSQAVITEVYALHLFFVALIILLCSGHIRGISDSALDRLSGLALGLALSNHLTSIFLLPVVLFWKRDWKTILNRTVFLALGLTPYIIIPLRAATNPPVNWGNASTWSGFIWLVSGRLYQDELFSSGLWARTQSSAALLLGQFGVTGLTLALTGLIVFCSRSRFHMNLWWVILSFAAFSLVYATRDSQVYFLSVILCLALGIGVTVGCLVERWPRRQVLIAGLVGAYLIFSAAQTWPCVDLSNDSQANQLGDAVLAGVPPEAMLFVKSDEAVFTLWYFHFALGDRPDIAVIAVDMLHHDWYQHMLRSAYPALVVPGPLPFDESVRLANPSRPACYLPRPDPAALTCLSPVTNTR